MKHFKTAIIGGGFIGGAHVEALRRIGNIEIVALCDEADVIDKAKKYNIPLAYDDYRKMLDEIQLDAIHICTPNNTHYEIAKYAIEKKINIVCEKPFTTTVEQAEELTARANEKGIKCAVNFHNRLYPMANQMHHMLKNKEIGDVITIHGNYIQDWLLYDTDYSWRLISSQVGKTRAIADIGSHWMDLAEFVTGLKIKKVSSLFSTVHAIRKQSMNEIETFSKADLSGKYREIEIDTEDAATVMFQFDNGAIGSLIVSQMFAGKKNSSMLCVAGKKGSIIWDSERLSEIYIGHRDKPNEVMMKDQSLMNRKAAALVSYPSGHEEGFPDAFKQMFKQFYQSIEEAGEYYYATFEDGLREMILCEAIFQSAKSGEWYTI